MTVAFSGPVLKEKLIFKKIFALKIEKEKKERCRKEPQLSNKIF